MMVPRHFQQFLSYITTTRFNEGKKQGLTVIKRFSAIFDSRIQNYPIRTKYLFDTVFWLAVVLERVQTHAQKVRRGQISQTDLWNHWSCAGVPANLAHGVGVWLRIHVSVVKLVIKNKRP
jgi:hypothetical protein